MERLLFTNISERCFIVHSVIASHCGDTGFESCGISAVFALVYFEVSQAIRARSGSTGTSSLQSPKIFRALYYS
jgi:hypothetical protein